MSSIPFLKSAQPLASGVWLRRSLAWLLMLGMLMPAIAMAQLTQRFSTSDNGNIVQTGNTLTTCTGSGCAAAQSGGTSSNQNFTIINVNTDPVGGSAPANSSTGDITLPPGSSVLWAGLYWSGRTATASGDGNGPIQAAARDFWFKVPGGSYQQVTALVADTFTFNTQGFAAARPYTAFLDVTTQVQAAGSGTYSGGGLTTTIGTDGNLGYYGGWALIIAYRDTTQPYRRIEIYNAGNIPVSTGNNQSVTVNGISTPISGDFTAYMGALVWEGDAGLTGDQFQLTGGDIVNPGPLSDAQSALTNFWNSRITNLGVVNTARNPANLNNFAIDLKLVDISNTPANAALPHLSNSADPSIGINATLSFTTSQDVYFPHALVFVTDLFRPDVIPTLLKTATKIGGSPGPDLHPGDTIEYTISFHNQGRDGAIRVVADDPIPVGLIYVPGSIQIIQDDGFPANVGPKSDATDGDTAEFDPGASPRGTLVYRVGGGATGGVPPPTVEGGTLLPNQGVVLRYRATIDPGFGGSIITNVVNITHGSLTFPNDPSQTVSGSVDSDITISPFPQMLLSKVANPTSIANLAGQTSQFTITAFNYNGPVTNVNLTDTLPANWAFVANSATITLPGGGTISGAAANPGISGQLLSWNLAQNMAAGETLSITFTAVTTAPPGGNSINNATVSGLDSGNTPVGANASATVRISDLRISKQASPTNVQPGDTVTYTVTVTNAGTSRQNNIVVNDPLPAGVTYVGQSTVATGFIGSSGDYFDQFNAIAFNGNNGSINFAAGWQETDNGGAGTGNGNIRVVNSGNCAAGNCLRIRANNTNDNIFRQADLTVPACTSASSIVLSYDFNNDLNNDRAVSAYIYRGGTQTTLLATYNGGNNGTGSFSQVLTPAEIGNNTRIRFNATQVGNQNSYLYVDNVRFTCTGTTAAIRDNVPAGANPDLINGIPANLVLGGDNFVLDAGQAMTVTYQVTINPGVGTFWQITNTASASSTEVPTPVSGNATVNVFVPTPALNTVKTLSGNADGDGSGTVTPGDVLSYLVTVTNTGNIPLTNVVVTDSLITPTGGTTPCASVPVGGTCTLTGTYLVTAGDVTIGSITNTGTGDSNETPPDDDILVTPVAGTVSMTKVLASGGPTAEAGETLTYTVTLTNSGGSAATGVEFAEAPSAGLTVTGIVAGPVPPGSNAGTCTVTGCTGITVGAGETLSYTVSATVENPLTQTVYTNLITPTGGTCAPGACEVDTPTAGNVSMTKVLASGGPTAEAGETLTYTVTLTNSGGSAATGVEFAEAPSAGLTVTGIVAGPVPPGSNAGTCTVTGCTGITVGAGETLSYTVSATVENPLTQTVYTNLITPTGGTCAPGACEVDTPTAGNVSMTKVLASGGPTAEAGETLTYTVTLTNSGGSAATGVEFAEAPSAGLTVTGIVAGPVPPGSNAGTCTVTGCTGITVGAGETLSYTVSATVENPLTQTVYTNLITPTGGTCAPGACEVDTPTAGNVSMTKVLASGGPTAEAGETLTYTVTLTNSGGSAATGVEFAEAPSAGLTVTGIVAGPVPPGSNAGTCTVTGCTGITVGAGETLSYTVSATVENPLTQTVYTNLITPTGGTCAPGACEVDTPTAANVSLVKTLTAENGTVAGVAEPGETLTYTITLTNNGGVNANGVGITDVLDPNVGFVSADNGGVFGAGSVTWTGLTVNAGGNLVLTVQTQVADPIPAGVTQILNLVHVTGSTPPACPPGGPQCVITPTLANLAVSKVLSGESITADGIAEPGEVLTYTITVSNAGGTVALNTIINEVVPQNTTFVADSPNIWVGCADGAAAGTACDTIVDVPAQSGGTPGTISVDFMVLVDDPLAVGVTSIFNAVALNDGTPPDCVALPTSPGCAVVPTANLRLTKVVDSVAPTGPGRYRVTYRIDIVNLGGSAGSYTLTDTFGFPGSGVVYTGNARVTTAGGTINPALVGGEYVPNNGTMVQISDNSVVLAIGATHTYSVSVPIGVQPGNLQDGTCTGATGNGLYNAASITGTVVLDSAACAPVGSDVPLIHLVKTVTLGQDADGDNYGDVGDVLEYEFTISNPGALPLTPVQLFDPRLQSLQCDPLTIGGQPLRVIPGDELYRDEFDVALGGALQPGDEVHCTGTYTLTAADVLRRQVVNTATATGTAVGGPSVSSVSTAIFTMFP